MFAQPGRAENFADGTQDALQADYSLHLALLRKPGGMQIIVGGITSTDIRD
jgi:hypothetical protein